MSLIIPANTLASGGYVVDNSLRFNSGSSDYLNRTPSASNRKTYTISTWIKRGELSSVQNIFTAGVSGRDGGLRWLGDNKLGFYQWDGSSDYDFVLQTSAMYRDVSAWYHIVVAVDTTQGTASNRIKLYVNGEQITSLQASSYPSLNFDTLINNNNAHYISGAVDTTYGARRFDGYMSEVCFIDGTALDPTSFGEFDEDSGIWKPIDVSGLTFGTNGFYLDFEDSAALGDDVSGNGNDFTVNNLTAIDQTTDTPTNNFATLNPLNKTSNILLGNGNVSVGTTNTGTDEACIGTIGCANGKWYWECKREVGTSSAFGIVRINVDGTTHSRVASGRVMYHSNGVIYTDGLGISAINTGVTYTTNDILAVAFDAENGVIKWYKNNNLVTDSTITNSQLQFSNDEWIPMFYSNNGNGSFTANVNFGNPPYTISSGNTDGNGYGNFEYAVPSGYLSLCTKNLSEVLG